MAVSDIFNRLPVNAPVLQSRVLDVSQLITNPLVEFNTTTPPDSPPINNNNNQQDEVLFQAQRFINQTLQNINTSQQTEVLVEANRLISQTFLGLDFGQSGQALTQAESFINDTLFDLNSVREAEILVLAETLANQTFQNLSTTQQAEVLLQVEVLINETLRNANLTPLDGSLAELTIPNPAALIALQTAGATSAVTATQGAVPGQANQTTLAGGQIQNSVAGAVTPVVETASIATTTSVLTRNPADVVQELIPVDPIPYGVSVYEVAAQKSTSQELKPVKREVEPTAPSESVRALDMFFFRPEWKLRKEGRQPLNIEPGIAMDEKSIRKIIGQLNEDQVNNNLPLRLVLAKHDKDYALDIYDCSDNAMCRLVYDTPLALNNLHQLLENLQHEDGILVNTTT